MPDERVAQMYAFFAFVCGSSSVHGGSYLDAYIIVDVPMLRTAEEVKWRYHALVVIGIFV
jgi:hypothetical protein